MIVFLNAARTALIAAVCFLVAACSQTSMSTYSGKIGGKKLTAAQMQKKKIAASRLRAKKSRIARKKAFAAKRAASRAGKKEVKAVASKRKASKRKAKRTAKKRLRKKTKVAYKAKRNRKLRKNKRSLRKRQVARKKAKRLSPKQRRLAARKKALKRSTKVARRVGKKQRIKKSAAYVGSVSRKAGSLNRNGKPWKCVPSNLKKVIKQIRRKYGRVTINSTHRSRRHNRMVGGKRRSMHLRCRAVDFRVHGRTRGLTRWLSRHPLVGGYKRYPSGYYHIDNGPRRTW